LQPAKGRARFMPMRKIRVAMPPAST
jgi:hypothetical protein